MLRLGNRQKERLVLTLVRQSEPSYSGSEGDVQDRLREKGLLEYRRNTRGGIGGLKLTEQGRKHAELVIEYDLQGRHLAHQRNLIRTEDDLKAVLRWMRNNSALQPAVIDCEKAKNEQENPRYFAVRALRHLSRLDTKTNDIWNAIAALENGLSYKDENGVRDSALFALEHLQTAVRTAVPYKATA